MDNKFYIIAENINVMSKSLGPAMKAREAKPIQAMAEKLVANGADYLDINLGPARKAGDELMDWVVKVVHEVADLPLYLDTTNVKAIEAGLKAHKESAGRPVINSISARPERMAALIPLAKEYDAAMVALVLGTEGIPRDENERGENAAMLLAEADAAGIAPENIWVDPIVVPVSSQQNQVQSCTEFVGMLELIAPGTKNTCGLSNVSNGSPEKLRPLLNQTYVCMLRHQGLTGAILDGLDDEIISFVRNKRDNLQKVVSDVMNGETPDYSTMNDEEVMFAKTTKVLLGHSLYSDSWLDL